MKRLIIQVSAFKAGSVPLMFLLVFALQGCNRGTDSKTGGAPATSPSPVSSSLDVVRLRTEAISLPGGNIDAKVLLSISPGFHVNANPATFSYLIATEVTTGKVEGITVGAPNYPAAVKKKFQFAEQPLAVYEGEVPIKLNLRAEKNAAAGPRSLPLTLRVQACDEEKCYPPATLNSTISVTVK
ncbi:MAG TPA: protein-disulfide reductase DsbD domain-containing protein [Pyrinomonadaceae bacterium]|nr:protein-disulfide reductase DsbD domain-containing protein [Pyrinomonadaceae bacterium]